MNAPFTVTNIASAARQVVDTRTAETVSYLAAYRAWFDLITQLPENSAILALLLRRSHSSFGRQ